MSEYEKLTVTRLLPDRATKPKASPEWGTPDSIVEPSPWRIADGMSHRHQVMAVLMAAVRGSKEEGISVNRAVLLEYLMTDPCLEHVREELRREA